MVLAVDSFSTPIVKVSNRYSVLNLVRYSPSGISRAELAHQMGLIRAAISLIINDLLQSGSIPESEMISASFRRIPIMLEITPSWGLVTGMDIGTTHLGLILTDYTGRIQEIKELPFDM